MLGDLRNAAGERLDYAALEGAEGRRDLVVIGHGVTGNKDREWAVTLSQRLAEAGFASVRFSFSGNGDSEGDFRESCPSKEAEDLGAVLDAADGWRVTFVGHSMGGAVGVLRASRDSRIEQLVSLAGMVDTDDFARRKFGDVEPGVGFMWDKPECPLSQTFLDDMAAIGSVEELAREVRVPWLLVHGTADTVVPFEESERVQQRAGGKAELLRLEAVDHVFSEGADEVMAAGVVGWLQRLAVR